MSESVNIPASEDLCRKIAITATVLAQRMAPKSKWGANAGAGARSLRPYWGPGWVGIHASEKYMLYQNNGIRPFIMWWAEGRVIPMRGPDGKIHFVTGSHVGERRIQMRDPKTGQILKGNNPIRWRHPGLKPKNFIEKGLAIAIKENMTNMAGEVAAKFFRGL